MIPRVIAGTSRTFLLTGLTRYQSRVTLVPQNYRAPISVIIDTATASCEPQFSAGFVGHHPQVWRIFIPAPSGKMKIQEPLGENGLPMPESSSVIVYLRRWSRWWATQQTFFARHNSRWDFIGWVSPETTARSLVLPTAGTASINKWTRLFSGIAIKFALLHLVKKWPNLKMAMQTKTYCTTTRLQVS